MEDEYKMIHLLYVPTMQCNMRCAYCYLGEQTDAWGYTKGQCGLDQSESHSQADMRPDKASAVRGCVETLAYAVDKFKSAGAMPFNISLHGGEVTCLPAEDFRTLVSWIADYYSENRGRISSQGFPVPTAPHIKTNLYGLDRHIDAIRDYNVTVSGSLDLPFSLHRQYRRTKAGEDTLDKILRNAELLADLPNKKKVSATIFREHMDRLPELAEDIRYLDEHTCLDMNSFNFMVGFADGVSLTPLSETEQVEFYEYMKKEFAGSPLERGFRTNWFAEFTPDYCTGCDNCGEKFFLLERNGDVYSCVRGQGREEFYYGNIYENTVKEIFAQARKKIYEHHSSMPLSDKCARCAYLRYCRTGCPFVKKLYHSDHSYTCLLQQAIYRDNPELYPASETPLADTYGYAVRMHPQQASQYRPKEESLVDPSMPTLTELIAQDKKLAMVYSDDAFLLSAGGVTYRMHSQILKGSRDIIYLCDGMPVKLYVKHGVMEQLADYPVNNSLYIMLLSGDMVTYGDEGRTKQEHIMTHQIYYRTLAEMESDMDGYYCVRLDGLLALYKDSMSEENPNNLFVTTTALRDYHYTKQKENAYYHIQAINLPFQNIELYYMKDLSVLGGFDI